MLRLPLVNRLFPRARIILALRHPCDVVLSNYMQNFRRAGVHAAVLDARAAGTRLCQRHAGLAAPSVSRPARTLFSLRHEDTADRFPGKRRSHRRFPRRRRFGADAHFHEHAQAEGYISTPSYAQVTEPVNRRAVDRWRRYAEHTRADPSRAEAGTGALALRRLNRRRPWPPWSATSAVYDDALTPSSARRWSQLQPHEPAPTSRTDAAQTRLRRQRVDRIEHLAVADAGIERASSSSRSTSHLALYNQRLGLTLPVPTPPTTDGLTHQALSRRRRRSSSRTSTRWTTRRTATWCSCGI